MSDSVKKWYEMQEEKNKIAMIQSRIYRDAVNSFAPVVSIEKKEVYDAFIYNLNCYVAKIIDREDFINAMEDYIYG